METTRQAIVATILDYFKESRSIYGIFHLLKGKKSAQTIQDGAFFGVLSYFGLFPSLKRHELEKDINHLILNGQAYWVEQDKAVLTNDGKEKLTQFQMENQYLSDLSGWQYHSYSEEFWLRICLYVQVITHIVSGNHQFYPITHQSSVQQWVKKHLPKSNDEREEKRNHIFHELYVFLSRCSDLQATIFVQQLSGENRVGLTKLQLAEQLRMDEITINLYHLSTVHRLLYELNNKKDTYEHLSLFDIGLKKPIVLTESARQTFQLFQKGHSIEEISRIRLLKQNTIEDHIVEIAILHPQFSIRPFVNKELEDHIFKLADKLQTSRLRELKEQLGSEVSFFVIRLVLARKKVHHGS
ncbi:helix-turn-helix domain-containing protein [Halalkalibacter kiskunsagensis]|uniref:Helix-turn-helix domain-containing protein n=1 Tax=Halalkalibacter kiskunsagensis TaxID=1548599 RepID=A0ABV6KJ10_9BACI